jgi:hypothetical protein
LDSSLDRRNWILHIFHIPGFEGLETVPQNMVSQERVLPMVELPDKKILEFHRWFDTNFVIK